MADMPAPRTNMFIHPPSPRLVTVYALTKGALVALVTLVIGTSFGQSLIIAFVSGGLGVFGMLGAAYIASRASAANRDLLHDIKGKVDANNRQGDRIAAERDTGETA